MGRYRYFGSFNLSPSEFINYLLHINDKRVAPYRDYQDLTMTPREKVVFEFYRALEHADGDRAVSLVVPEKRNKGNYTVDGIKRYYGSLKSPLYRIDEMNNNNHTVRVAYYYGDASGKSCSGKAWVETTPSATGFLIKRIISHGEGCSSLNTISSNPTKESINQTKEETKEAKLLTDQIKEIQTLYSTAQELKQRKQYKVFYFKNIYLDNTQTDQWSGWIRGDGKPKDGEFAGDWADVYMKENAVFMVKLETLTPSGDWGCYSDYYFRPDTSLAFIFSEFRTFSGGPNGTLVARRQYYDHGKLIKNTKQVFDLKNKNKIIIPENISLHHDEDCPEIFQTISNLPFYSLMK